MSFEAENLRFLAEADPDLADELRAADPTGAVVEPARRQGDTLRFGAAYVHSKYHPAKEAASLIRRIEEPPSELHVHFGFGLGYFAEADATEPGGEILAFEPNPALAAAALRGRDLKPLLAGRRLRLTCSATRFQTQLRAKLADATRVRVFISPYHGKAHSEALRDFVEKVKREVNRKTLLGKSNAAIFRKFLQSTAASWPHTTRLPGVDRLAGAFKGAPATLLLPGPSLDKNLSALLPRRDKTLIFTVARAVRVLERWGVAPDFLVHNEAQDYRHLIEGCGNLAKTTFLLAEQCHPRMFGFPHGLSFVYQNPGNGLTQWLIQQAPAQRKQLTETAGSVATEAFFLALIMGCNPIVLAGQDLALKRGRFYARAETNLNLSGADKALRHTPAFFGGKTLTLTNYLHFISWYEEAAVNYRDRFANRRLINATEGGARLRGFEPLKLRDAARHCFPRRLQVEPVVMRAAAGASPLAPSKLRKLAKAGADAAVATERLCREFLTELGDRNRPPTAQRILVRQRALETAVRALPMLPAYFEQELKTADPNQPAALLSVMAENAAIIAAAAKQVRALFASVVDDAKP